MTLQHKNQFSMPKDATQDQFHTLLQQDTYHQVYESKLFAIHKYINWFYLNKKTRYARLYSQFRLVGLDGIVSLKCDFQEDVIR